MLLHPLESTIFCIVALGGGVACLPGWDWDSGDTILNLVLFDWPFQGCGGPCGLCPGSGPRRACDSSFGV